MKNKILSFLLILNLTSWAQTAQKLWYKQPALYFEETFLLGNGTLGATVHGGIEKDKIYLNDATLWTGGPVNRNMNPEAYKAVPEIRAALKNEDYKLADQLQKKIQGKYSESYAPMGTLWLEFDHDKAENYYRELDLNTATARVSYQNNAATVTREYLVSNPHKAVVIKLTGGQKNKINCTVKLTSLLRHQFIIENNTLIMSGYAPLHVVPNYLRNSNPVSYDETKGTRFANMIKVKNTGGSISYQDSSIVIKNATNAVIYLTAATSFNGFDKDPVTEGKDYMAITKANLNASFAQNFEKIKATHIADYQKFYKRFTLNLGQTKAPDLPTDERLMRYSKGDEDRKLEELYFNFGRYLLISSSRTDGVPANLQGIWNPFIRPPWSSNYTININAEENYWAAETTNLSELHRPLLTFIGNLAQTGRVTAKTFLGVNGWMAGHNTDIWAMSNTVGNFGSGDPVWANWYMGGAWLSTHLWEHYTFTKDLNFLKSEAYPIMKEAAVFCNEWLVKDAKNQWITSPGTSPENNYKTDTGYVGASLYGATADLAFTRELFLQTIKAAKVLGVDEPFVREMQDKLENMHPYQVGKKGNLQEWYYDWDDADPKHRHQTHLFGLYPGHHISPNATPELAEASRKTLEIKGDETTGWSKGWRINLWARLKDGNHAYKMYRELLTYVEPDAIRPKNMYRGGTYPNLMDAHPPFQIDGNFGGTAAIAEMLVQSSDHEIQLLPALPDTWPSGSVNGLCARGGFEISMKWVNGQPGSVFISSKKGGSTTVIFGSKTKKVSLKAGERKQIIF